MKYIIDIPDEYENDYTSMSPLVGKEFCYPIRNMNKTYVIPTGLKIEPYTEPDRQAIEDEVWKFTGKIQKMTCEQMHEVLGITAPNYDYFCNEISYQEAKSKYESWKAEKAEIRVGDEVKENSGLWGGVVVGFDEFDALVIMDSSGKSCGGYKTKFFKKTGRHFDEVEELLRKIKED